MADTLVKAADYTAWLAEVKSRVQSAQISAARAVSRDLILLYWDIGRGIVEKQNAHGWGQAVIDRLSRDLSTAFPAVTGFSPRNLRNMRQFYTAYSQPEFLRQAVAELNRQSSVPFADEKWQHAVAKLNQEGNAEELLYQIVTAVPWGHNWRLDQVRHDGHIQPNVKRSRRLTAAAL